MKRMLLMLAAAALMALMMVGGPSLAFAEPGGGAEQSRVCSEDPISGTSGCSHTVRTPSGNFNAQSQTRDVGFEPARAFVLHTTRSASSEEAIRLGHQSNNHLTSTPSENQNSHEHLNPLENPLK
jgi:hypothetical protein